MQNSMEDHDARVTMVTRCERATLACQKGLVSNLTQTYLLIIRKHHSQNIYTPVLAKLLTF
jgi:hypothetical protein